MTTQEVKSILKLAIPLIIGQIGQMLLSVADTVMVGRLGVTELAALTYANTLFYLPFIFGIGILTCVSVRTARARGSDDPPAARNVCRNSLYLAILTGACFLVLSIAFLPFLHSLGQPTEVASLSKNYFLILMSSIIPCMMSIALKNHADALDRAWPAFWIFMGGVVINIFLNSLLIFGHWGFPRLGLEGAGIATLIARWLIVIAMLIWFAKATSLRQWTPERWFKAPDWAEIKQQCLLGFPAGLHTLAEVSSFSIAGLLIGHFGADALASHQIALNTSGMAFMIPLGLSMALSVRMGEAHQSVWKQKDILWTGLFLTLASSCATALLFFFGGHMLASWFIDTAHIITAAATLIGVAALFQIVDGIQVASTGMLRGLHDTRTPAIIGIISYWCVGIPSGYLLAHKAGLGPKGIWWGLAIGLATAALLLCIRLVCKVQHNCREASQAQ